MDKIFITDLPRALRAEGIDTSYNACWRAATEGRIPAEKQGRQWFVKTDDLPKVRAFFAPVSN